MLTGCAQLEPPASMPRVVKRSAPQAVKSGPSRGGVPLPPFIPPQLSRPVQAPPSGPQWLHEIKLDGYRMAARIDNARVQLLTRTGSIGPPNTQAPLRPSRM
jgi:bifunctional non-homologous end joining protein LigD